MPDLYPLVLLLLALGRGWIRGEVDSHNCAENVR